MGNPLRAFPPIVGGSLSWKISGGSATLCRALGGVPKWQRELAVNQWLRLRGFESLPHHLANKLAASFSSGSPRGALPSPRAIVVARLSHSSSYRQGTLRCAALFALAFRPPYASLCLPTVAPRGGLFSRPCVPLAARGMVVPLGITTTYRG